MIELLWAEVSDRTWPVSEDHHLSFLNLGGTLTWKTSCAEFCALMLAGKETTRYILDLSREGGCSLWLRKTGTGKVIFAREILERAFVCLDDYHQAGRDGKEAASHLLSGRTQIPVENATQTIRCATLINLNPHKGTTVFEKAGLDAPLIRRLVPCDLDAIELPDLKKIGQEALDAARKCGPLRMEKPTSSCREHRTELITNFEKLFTEEGQRYIDIEGLLNIARGLTGYGLTPLDAVRYVLYTVSLPYHTVGCLRPEWTHSLNKEKPEPTITKLPAPRAEAEKKLTSPSRELAPTKPVGAKSLETLRKAMKFQEEYEDELDKIKKSTAEIEEVKQFLEKENLSWEEVDQFLLEEGYRVPSPRKCANALQEVNKEYGNIEREDRVSLENLKRATEWLTETYIRPLTEAQRRLKGYKETWDQIWGRLSSVKRVSQIPPLRKLIDESPLASCQKERLKGAVEKKKTALEEERRIKSQKLVD